MTPAAQTTTRLAMRSDVSVPPSSVTPAPSIPITVRPAGPSRRGARSDRSAFADSEGGKLVSTRSATSMSRMPRPARGSMLRKSSRSVSRASSAIWPAISTPVGPAPTTTNVSQAWHCLCVRLGLGGFERSEEAAANRECTLQGLDLGTHASASPRGQSTSSASLRRRSACRSRAVLRRSHVPTQSRRCSSRARGRSRRPQPAGPGHCGRA